jgi:CheY-like chemotaxis protein
MKENIIRGKRILVVDDEPSVIKAYRMVLEFDGHTVTDANSVEEALILFTEGQFDLLVTDFDMAGMKGDAFAVRIKTLAPQQPILMVTDYGKELGDSENPVDCLLNKPCTLDELRGAIAKLLPNRV